LIPTVGRVVQQHLFRAALGELATLGEPVNRVIEVDLDGDDVSFALYDLSAGDPSGMPSQAVREGQWDPASTPQTPTAAR
jgi:hypothetical protein